MLKPDYVVKLPYVTFYDETLPGVLRKIAYYIEQNDLKDTDIGMIDIVYSDGFDMTDGYVFAASFLAVPA